MLHTGLAAVHTFLLYLTFVSRQTAWKEDLYTLFSGLQQSDAESKSVKRQNDVYRSERPDFAATSVRRQIVTGPASPDFAKNSERPAPQTRDCIHPPVGTTLCNISTSSIHHHQSSLPPVSRDVHESQPSRTDANDRPPAASSSQLMVIL